MNKQQWIVKNRKPGERHEAQSNLQQQVNHWKSNHDNMVLKNAVLSQRPDLPLDRIPACEEIDELRGQVLLLRNALNSTISNFSTLGQYIPNDDSNRHKLMVIIESYKEALQSTAPKDEKPLSTKVLEAGFTRRKNVKNISEDE